MALELIFAILLVLANGFFVATEFAIARLRPTQVEELERAGKPGARSVRHAVEHIDAYLAACQLGITLASIGLGVVGKPVFQDLLEPVLGDAASIGGFGLAAALAFGIVTLLHVVVGELSPKSVAISRTVPTAVLVAPPMRAFYIATKPLVDSFNGLGNLLLRPFGIPPASEAGHAPHSEEELRTILRESREGGLIEEGDQELAENVFAFGDARVREIMTPRGEIDYLTTDDDVGRAIELAIETGHTRLPLAEPEKGLDDPMGLIHAKDLLPAMASEDSRTLKELARPITRVSEAALLSEVLPQLRLRHLALAADEHGTTIGLVTLEDVIEELVGEIEDEFDLHEEPDVRREGDTWMVPGSLGVRDLARELDREIDDSHEATIGGYLVEVLGRVPDKGETVEVNGMHVEVVETHGPLLQRLRVRRAEEFPED
jgi:CBS domain containing-hemolysin-like protein